MLTLISLCIETKYEERYERKGQEKEQEKRVWLMIEFD